VEAAGTALALPTQATITYVAGSAPVQNGASPAEAKPVATR